MTIRTQKERYLWAFLLGCGLMLITFIPFIIYENGLFIYYGDYNAQQIPFYQMAHDAVRSGNIFWNWQTDLGTNFIGSYSFYLLGSPFFWLTIPFPSAWVPYLMPLLTCLKYGIASLTAYAFIRRFVKNTNIALIGSLLYAFSGFSSYNLFFNHFHEAIAFFPLLLIALEESVINNRKGYFALAVALCAITNYYFFAGQVIFLIIYFIIRCFCKDFNVTFGKILRLAIESILGVAISSVLLIPSIMMVTGNPRVGADDVLSGWNMVYYNVIQRYFTIVQSFFFVPDVPARPNFFPDNGSKWASIAGYLPLFSMVGVITFMSRFRKHWAKRIIAVCIFMAFIPICNSIFQLFNGVYYARWFYMPILIMALATALVLDKYGLKKMRFGFGMTVFITACFAIIGVIPTVESSSSSSVSGNNTAANQILFGKLPANRFVFWCTVAFSAASLICLGILILNKNKKRVMSWVLVFTCVFAIGSTCLEMGIGRSHGPSKGYIKNNCLDFSLNLDDDGFYRIDTYNELDNIAMNWNCSSIESFHSIITESGFNFYKSMGIDRGVATRPEYKYYGLRAITSVKYVIKGVGSAGVVGTSNSDLPGYRYIDTQNNFEIYENQYYIPMGYSYKYYFDKNQLNNIEKKSIDKLYVQGLYLTDEQIQKYSQYMYKLDYLSTSDLDEEAYYSACTALSAYCASSFEKDNYGFTSTVNMSKTNLMVYSVPYDKGWSATVNGEPVEIENVNNGFMAVLVPAGEATVRFTYKTPGLALGVKVTLISGFALLVYILIWFVLGKVNPEKFGKKKYAHLAKMDIITDVRANNAYISQTVNKISGVSVKLLQEVTEKQNQTYEEDEFEEDEAPQPLESIAEVLAKKAEEHRENEFKKQQASEQEQQTESINEPELSIDEALEISEEIIAQTDDEDITEEVVDQIVAEIDEATETSAEFSENNGLSKEIEDALARLGGELDTDDEDYEKNNEDGDK